MTFLIRVLQSFSGYLQRCLRMSRSGAAVRLLRRNGLGNLLSSFMACGVVPILWTIWIIGMSVGCHSPYSCCSQSVMMIMRAPDPTDCPCLFLACITSTSTTVYLSRIVGSKGGHHRGDHGQSTVLDEASQAFIS